jgi:hypothetical protein
LKLIRLAVIGLGGLIAFSFVKFSRRTSCAIGLGVKSYTNCAAVVSFTNRSDLRLDFVLKVERKGKHGWPVYPAGIPMGTDFGQSGRLNPGEVFTAPVPVMVYAPPCPWRVSVFYYKPVVPPSGLRRKAVHWLLRLHLPKLTHKVVEEFKPMQVSSAEMEQWQK